MIDIPPVDLSSASAFGTQGNQPSKAEIKACQDFMSAAIAIEQDIVGTGDGDINSDLNTLENNCYKLTKVKDPNVSYEANRLYEIITFNDVSKMTLHEYRTKFLSLCSNIQDIANM